MILNEPQIISFLHHLADLAAKETLPRFRNLETIENKLETGFDPVTEADRAAERVIRETIIGTFPSHGVIGEEYGEYQSDSEFCWVIDPIDGTKAFISGIPMWGTLIALCKDMIPIAGIMSQPFTEERYIGMQSGTRYIRQEDQRTVKTSSLEKLADAILMTTTPDMFQGKETKSFRALSEQCRLVRYGADCYAYCLLAAGHIEVVLEAGLNFYDIAAVIPIIENAGGIVTDWEGNPNPQGGKILATCNRQIHETALKQLAET